MIEHGMESSRGRFLMYEAPDGELKLEVRLEDETVWLTQQMMAELFETTKQNVSQHIKAIYADGELISGATVKKFFTVRREGSREVHRELEFLESNDAEDLKFRVDELGAIIKGCSSALESAFMDVVVDKNDPNALADFIEGVAQDFKGRGEK